MSTARVNGVVLLLCAMALGSMVESTSDPFAPWFWLARAAGVSLAIAALFRPRLQPAALAGVAAFMVVVPCALQMAERARTGRHRLCHDSVIQFEEAITMVRAGDNPYARDFKGTPMERWNDWGENPALHHFVYPPFLLYISVPFAAVGKAIGFYDQRVVLLLFYLSLLAVAWRMLRDRPDCVAAVALIALNPWFGPFVVEGRNDGAMIFWVLGAWLAYSSGRPVYGHLLMGLAIATKTLMLPVVPFLIVAHRRSWAGCATLLLAPIVVTSLPFLAADPGSFVEDLLGAPAGLGDHPFEIRGWGGFGFANLVLALGLVKSKTDYFPFSIFQFAAALPCLWYGIRSVSRDAGFGNVLLWSAATIFALLFFGRFIHDNYIGALLSLVVMAQAARESPPAAGSIPSTA